MGEMQDKSDAQLLRDYAEHGSENVFRELVTRHMDFVYSAALRQVNSPDLAGDIAQTVFTDLARKARSLAEKVPAGSSLAGWLHRSTRYAALNHLRDTRRRHANERQAMEQLLTDSESAPDWELIRPVLDEALDTLGDEDREALLLRFFKNQDLRTVGRVLGVSDDAAQKRVSRAVERLREFLTKRGVTVGASGLVLVISANAVQAAPVGLAVTISTTAALTGTTIAATATATATKVIAMTTLQKTLITATIAAAVVTPVAIQHQAQVKLRDENASLRQQIEQLTPLTAENERLSNLIANASPALSKDQLNDLLRLRNEVGTLRRQTNEVAKLREENRRLQDTQAKVRQNVRPTKSPEDTAGQVDFPRESWAFAGYANPESAILSLASAAVGGDLETFLNSLTPHFQAEQQEKWQRDGKNDVQIRDNLVKEFGRTETIRILNKENISENEIILSLLIDNGGGHNETPRMKVQRIGDEWKMAGPYRPLPPKQP